MLRGYDVSPLLESRVPRVGRLVLDLNTFEFGDREDRARMKRPTRIARTRSNRLAFVCFVRPDPGKLGNFFATQPLRSATAAGL